MWWRALRDNRRSILAFCLWAVASMTVVCIAYGLAYLVDVPLAGLPIWFAITMLYALALAASLILTHAVLWAGVLLARRAGFAAAAPGLLLQAVACCAGADIGTILGEYVKWGLLGARPNFSPVLPMLVQQWWTGIGFLFLRLSVRYAARYRRIKAATKLAQGQVLASQLKPHFLFNSLHALSELIETDAPRGAEMAHRLSELFRHIAEGAQHATTPLSTELAIVREYLEIEKVRLGERLTYSIDEPSWSKERYVPTLMLQTLVENAIKHGIAPSVDGGLLRVSFRERDDGLLEGIVTNTGMPFEPSAAAKGVGLANTRDRLRQLYGAEGTLTLGTGGDGTRACFAFTGEAVAQDLGR